MSELQRSEVPQRGSHHEYREELRTDFSHSCGYCTISETEAKGLRFEIDHYLPEEHFPALRAAYFNLLYACEHCNGNKSDAYASEAELAECRRFFRPDWDRRRDHFELEGARLKARSVTGEHSITMLRLNRQVLERLRAIRKRLFDAEALIEGGVASLRGVSLDEIARERRFFFKERRDRLLNDVQALGPLVAELLASARSEFLDPDLSRAEQLAERSAYRTQHGIPARGPRKVSGSSTRRRRRR